jgi:uncharacterized protein (TIGR02117 family)
MIKKILMGLLYAILGFIVFVLLYLFAAYILSRIGVNKNQKVKGTIPAYILTNGVHTDIVVPVKTTQINWNEIVSYNNTIGKDSLLEWIAFGWGDRGFYLETPTWGDLTFKVAFKAVFGLSTSAMHITYHNNLIEGDDCRKFYLTEEQYQKLINYINNSFLVDDEQQKPILIETDAVYGHADAFYEAKGSYSLFHTCNTWSNNGLKAAEQRASLWTPFETGIFYQYPLPGAE